MKRKFDLVAFDLDGTLIDGRYTIQQNINHALALHGYGTLDNDTINRMIGIPLKEIFERVVPESGKHLAGQLVKDYRARYRYTSHEGVVILDGVVHALNTLKNDGFKLAVVTSKADDEVKPLMERLGLAKYFDFMTGYRAGAKPKPDPDMIILTMEALHVGRDKTAMVGDTPMDVISGRNAGVYTIAVKTGVELGMSDIDSLQKARPDVVIDSMNHLPPHLYKAE